MDIQAGDVVFHRPSGEEWFVLGTRKYSDQLCVAGWPHTIANISDCDFVERREITPAEIKSRNSMFGSNWDLINYNSIKVE